MRSILYTLLFSLLALVTPAVQAQRAKKPAVQPTPSMRERVRSEKRAYLVQRLSLTAKEAEDITPILDELDEKRFQLWREGEALARRVRQGDKTLTEAELYAFLDSSLSARIKEAELEKTYFLRCQPYLEATKLVRLPMACREFARRFFEQHKH